MGFYLNGSITISPAVPASKVVGTAFLMGDDSDADVFVDAEPWVSYGDGMRDVSLIEMKSSDGRCAFSQVVEDLKAIVELLGDGYTYEGEFNGYDDDMSEEMRQVRIFGKSVCTDDGETVYGPVFTVTNADLDEAAGRVLERATLDLMVHRMQARKAEFIAQILGEVNGETASTDALSYAEVKAAATGGDSLVDLAQEQYEQRLAAVRAVR